MSAWFCPVLHEEVWEALALGKGTKVGFVVFLLLRVI